MTNSATATVAHCFGGYMLPEGLTEGEIVKLLAFDHGNYTAECSGGRRFSVASNCVVAVPHEFYANHRAETFFKRMRSLFRSSERQSGLSIVTEFKYLRFTVFGDDSKPVERSRFTNRRFSISALSFESELAAYYLRCGRGLTAPKVRPGESHPFHGRGNPIYIRFGGSERFLLFPVGERFPKSEQRQRIDPQSS